MVKKKFEEPLVDSSTVDELSKKLLEANDKLKRAENERKIMIENISHDLRAPLTAIRSTIDYLKERVHSDGGEISENELETYLGILDLRAKTLETLVQDLYYLTCIESGTNKLEFIDIPINQFLEEYFFSAQIDDKYKDYELVIDVDENMNERVHADVAKLNRVLDNLFTNARKYSPKGSKIELGASKTDKVICFYVKDNGYGIPEEKIPYVFDRTYRVSDSRSPADNSGSGLGLSIAKTIVKQHGGEIKCESKVGKGSTFRVFLPIVNTKAE